MSTFNYGAYYQRVQDSKKMQIPRERISWIERFEPPERAYEVVLYLGCNILRTPDIAADVTWVFDRLGVDFVAAAGVQFCCGITWHRHLSCRTCPARRDALGPRSPAPGRSAHSRGT